MDKASRNAAFQSQSWERPLHHWRVIPSRVPVRQGDGGAIKRDISAVLVDDFIGLELVESDSVGPGGRRRLIADALSQWLIFWTKNSLTLCCVIWIEHAR